MRTTGAELRTEAAIYAEGTSYSGAYLATAYESYANDIEEGGETPADFQRWMEANFPSCCTAAPSRSAYEAREMEVDGPKDTPEELMKHADEWEALAEEQDTKDGQAARNRAATYRRAAQTLRLEARTGTPHCACCLKPTAETGCHRPKRPTR